MDFVVIGLGLSALALLAGLTLLCLVAPRWFRKAGVAQPGDAAYARAQAGERHALGQGFLCVGAVLLLTTLGGISAGLTDKAGAYLIAAMTTVAVLGLFGWDLLYRRQHPVPRRRRPALAQKKSDADDASTTVPTASMTATTVVRRRVLPARQRVGPVTAPSSQVVADGGHTPEDEPPPHETLPSTVGTSTVEAAIGGPPDLAAGGEEAGGDVAATSEAALDSDHSPGNERTVAAEAAEVAAVLPEHTPFAPVPGNGAADASAERGDEPELVPHGDDRVIALFPTAAARRNRTLTAPTDPDGQS